MNQFFVFLGWMDVDGNWDGCEVSADIAIVSTTVLIVISALSVF